MKIQSFEIDSYGKVVLETSTRAGRTKHEYYGAPKAIIKWLINCAKEPDLKDFEDKLSAWRDKQDTKNCSSCGDYWSKGDDE